MQVTDPLEFQNALAQIAANGSGANSIEYTGPVSTLVVDTSIVLPGGNSTLDVIVNSNGLTIGSVSDGSLTVGRNSTVEFTGRANVSVGGVGNGALIVDGGTFTVLGEPGTNNQSCLCLSYSGGGASELIVRNGGVINLGTSDGAEYTQFFAGYGGSSTITLDNGRINFGENGASFRIGLGGSVTMDLRNGSVIDSSNGASHMWIGEFTDELVTVNIDNSSIFIIGGGTNTTKDERAFSVGYKGGSGVVNQNGDDSHVRIAGIYRIGIAEGNGSTGTYNLNGGLLEIGTETMKDAFRVGVNVYNSSTAKKSNATFNVNGGTALLHGDLRIADSGFGAYLSNGTVNLNSGKISVGGKVHFGGGTGVMNLNGGALELGGSDVITGSGALNFNGGTIRATSDLSIAHVGTVDAGGAKFDSNGHTLTYSGILSGDGAVIKEGTGTLVLTGSNTFTGGVIARGGVLETGHANAIGGAGSRITLDGGTVKLTTLVDLTGGITAGAAGGYLDLATHDITLGGASAGAGGVTFNNGNVILGGTLAWSGVTGLGDGVALTTTAANQLSANSTLQLAGTATLNNGAFAQTLGGLAGSGSVTTGGTLSIGANNASTQFDGVISGAAEVRKVGTGMLTFTQAQTYTGGTVVEAGTLALSGNGAFAADSTVTLLGGILDLGGKTLNASHVLLQGGSVANGTLALLGDFTVGGGTLDTALTGTGDLIMNGAGTLVLSGDAPNFSGAVVIEQGEVQGSIAAFGTSGVIQNNGTVTFVESGDAVWDGAITGTGGLTLSGGGNFEIIGDGNTYSGDTVLQGGTLRVNGSLINSTVVVGGNAILGGSGVIGGIASSGIVGPGNSIGTLSVAGDATFEAGSTYVVEVNAAGESDRINAAGAVVINGGTVQVIAEAEDYERRTNYTILTADGGITGRFDSVTSNYAFLTPTLTYSTNEIDLQLDRNDRAFGTIATTANAAAVAGAVEQLGFGNPVYNAVLFATEEQAVAGFDMLSGEVHASTRSAIIEDSRHVRDAMADRTQRALGTEGLALWTAGYGSWGELDGAAGIVSMDRESYGAFAGLDAAIGTQGRVGILAGYGEADLDSARGTADVNSYHLGVYGGVQVGALGLQAGAARSWHDVDTKRSVAFNGFSDALDASYDASTTQVFGGINYVVPMGTASIEPFAQIAYVRLSTDDFEENGGAAALVADDAKSSATFSTLGVRAASAPLGDESSVAFRGSVGWRHAFDGRLPIAELAFDEREPFTVVGAQLSKNAAVIEAGVDVALSQRVALGVTYNGQYGNNGTDHGVKVGLSFGF